ncbi:hypothetical protein FWD20_02625 [Candidatus Saccharibacteria bacterium]|nr:hypothetical protein [Candidatus Saccharibacteria bacterium]
MPETTPAPPSTPEASRGRFRRGAGRVLGKVAGSKKLDSALKLADLKDRDLDSHKEKDTEAKGIIEEWNREFNARLKGMSHEGEENLNDDEKAERKAVQDFSRAVVELAEASAKLQGISPFGRKKKEERFEEAKAQYHQVAERLAQRLGQEYDEAGNPAAIAGEIVSFTTAMNTHVHEEKLRIMRGGRRGRLAEFLGKPDSTPWREKTRIEKCKKVGRLALTGGIVGGLGLAAAATGAALIAPGAAAITSLVAKGGLNITRGYLASRGRDDFYSRRIETIDQLAGDIAEKRAQAWKSLGKRAVGTVLFAGTAYVVGTAVRGLISLGGGGAISSPTTGPDVGANPDSPMFSGTLDPESTPSPGVVVDVDPNPSLSPYASDLLDKSQGSAGANAPAQEPFQPQEIPTPAPEPPPAPEPQPAPVEIGEITSASGKLDLPNGESINYDFNPETHTLNIDGETFTFDDTGQPTGNTQTSLDELGLSLKPQVEHVDAVTESWSPEALDVHPGEGGFDTLKEMGVASENRDALWRAVQGELRTRGITMEDPTGSGLDWLASPDIDFKPEDLQYVADTAKSMGISIDTPNVTEAHDALTGFDVEYTAPGSAPPLDDAVETTSTMSVKIGGATINGVIDPESHVLSTTKFGDLPLAEKNGSLSLDIDKMDIHVAPYDLNDSNFEPGEEIATLHMSMLDRDVVYTQGGYWDGKSDDLAATAGALDEDLLMKKTNGILNAVDYDWTGGDTSLGDPGVTIAMAHTGYAGGGFDGLEDAFKEGDTFTVTSGGTTYTYQFTDTAGVSSGKELSELALDAKHQDGNSYLMLQTCPRGEKIIKDIYIAKLIEVNSTLNFVGANGELVSIPGTIDVVNHEFHSEGLGTISLAPENTLPNDFSSQISTTVNDLPSDEVINPGANVVTNPTPESAESPPVEQPSPAAEDTPRPDSNSSRGYWDNLSTAEKVSSSWAPEAFAFAVTGVATALGEKARSRELKTTKSIEEYLTEIRDGKRGDIASVLLPEMFNPDINDGVLYVKRLDDQNGANVELTEEGRRLVKEFISSYKYDKDAIGSAFHEWFSNRKPRVPV